jgi:hypothetical protein
MNYRAGERGYYDHFSPTQKKEMQAKGYLVSSQDQTD